MVNKVIFKALIIFLFLASMVQAEEYDYHAYWTFTGNTITVAWDLMPNAIEYQVELYHVEQKVPVALGRTTSTQINFICPRSGHYIFKAKSIGETEESIWSLSTDVDIAKVGDIARAWWIYCRVAPPTGSEIE